MLLFEIDELPQPVPVVCAGTEDRIATDVYDKSCVARLDLRSKAAFGIEPAHSTANVRALQSIMLDMSDMWLG